MLLPLFDEVNELFVAALSILEEVMFEQFDCAAPLLRVLDQTAREEVSKERRPMCVLESGRLLVQDFQQYFLLCFLLHVGRIALSQLQCEDPETPNVHLCIILCTSLD